CAAEVGVLGHGGERIEGAVELREIDDRRPANGVPDPLRQREDQVHADARMADLDRQPPALDEQRVDAGHEVHVPREVVGVSLARPDVGRQRERDDDHERHVSRDGSVRPRGGDDRPPRRAARDGICRRRRFLVGEHRGVAVPEPRLDAPGSTLVGDSIAFATVLMALVSSFLATPAGAVPLAYVRSGGGIAIVDTDAGVTRKIVPWNRVDGPHGAFAISGPPLAVRGRMVFPYAVTGNGSRSWTSYLLSLDPDSNSATDVPVPGDVAGAGSFQTALFTVAVAPTHDAVYLTGTLTRADGSSSPAVLGYDVASGATHVVASAGVCDAGAHGSCSSCPCGPLIDFLPAPDGTRVYVLRDPNPGSFVRHVELAIVD